jgi:hypothetical protein
MKGFAQKYGLRRIRLSTHVFFFKIEINEKEQ